MGKKNPVYIIEYEGETNCYLCENVMMEGEGSYLICKGKDDPEDGYNTVISVCKTCMDELKVSILEML